MVYRKESSTSSVELFMLSVMIVLSIALGILLLSNQKEVNRRAAEVDRVQRDLVSLSEEIQTSSSLEGGRVNKAVEQEKLARERLQWTEPGEFIIRIKEH